MTGLMYISRVKASPYVKMGITNGHLLTTTTRNGNFIIDSEYGYRSKNMRDNICMIKTTHLIPKLLMN